MTVKQILVPVIKQELKKYRDNGEKIRLKTATKKRIVRTVICVLIFVVFNDIIYYPSVTLFVLFVYACLMIKTNNANIIMGKAKKNPNIPVEEIIANDAGLKSEICTQTASVLISSENSIHSKEALILPNIHTRTYNEALLLSRCVNVRRYVPEITENMIEEMYSYIYENTNNIVIIKASTKTISFIDSDGKEVKTYPVEVTQYLNKIVIGISVYNVQSYEYRYDYD